MHRLWTPLVKTAYKPVAKLVGLYTNAQAEAVSRVGVWSYTTKRAQLLCSTMHSQFHKLHLLNKVVHTFPRAYNYNYLYKVSNKERLV